MSRLVCYLGKEQVGSTFVEGCHAPNQDETLAQEVSGEEVQEGIDDSLEDGEDGQHHPVPHPGEGCLPVVAHDCVQ